MAIKKLSVKGMIQSVLSKAQLGSLTIELYDQNQKIRGVIARTQTNTQGQFGFELNALTLKREFQRASPEVFLLIKKDNRVLSSTLDEIVLVLTKNINNLTIVLSKEESVSLAPEKRELPKLDMKRLLRISGVRTRDLQSIEKKLKQSGLNTIRSILAKPGELTSAKTSLNKDVLTKFKAVTKFSAAAGSEAISAKLIDKGFLSFTDIGALPKSALLARAGKLNKSENIALNVLYQKASNVRHDVLDKAAFRSRLNSKDGLWLLDPKKHKRPTSVDTDTCRCESCSNVFSPYAYLINLLDMIHDHWGITTRDLEILLLQKIDALDCKAAQECVLQVELAIEILEKDSRISLPITDSTFNEDMEKVWVNLLFGEVTDKNIQLFRTPDLLGLNHLEDLIKILSKSHSSLKPIKLGFNEVNKHIRAIRTLREKLGVYFLDDELFKQEIEQSYQAVLILYRDALANSTRKTKEQLQKEWFIDFKAAACHKTNRLTFLILSLQSFILSARTGALAKFSRPDLEINRRNTIRILDSIPVEEASWKWMKDYSSWASAMYVFLYPENSTFPFLSDRTGQDFAENIRSFLTSDMTRTQVFQGIFQYYFDENAREYIRNQNQNLANQYPIIFQELIEAGEGYFDAAQISVEDFMRNLSSLIHYYQGQGGWTEAAGYFDVIPYPKLEKSEIKNSLYFPLLAAYTLNKSEHYASAHDWYRLLYDPTKSGNDRFGFDFDHHFGEGLSIGEEWNKGILDPNEIAHRREGVMLRSVIIMMVKNILDWADHEFALATPSSLDRARDLYELAAKVLNSPDLVDKCFQSIRELVLEIVTTYGPNLAEPVEDLGLIDAPEIISRAIDDIRAVLPDTGDVDPSPIETIVKAAVTQYQDSQSATRLGSQVETRRTEISKYEDQLLQNTGSQNNASGVSPYFFSSGTGLAGPNSDYHERPEIAYTNSIAFCVPPNPVLIALDAYITLSLRKIQLCLDITGEPLPTVVINDESQAEFFDTVNSEVERQPLLVSSVNWSNAVPRYRYSYLVEKARQYTEVAQRMGSALLAAQVNFDNARFDILRAQHAIELASSTIDLRNLGLRDAVTGLKLADEQYRRAQTQVGFWQDRIDDGMLSDTEIHGLNLLNISAWIQILVGAAQVAPIAAVVGTAGAIGGALSATGAGLAPGLVILAATAAAGAAALPVIAQGTLTVGGGIGAWGNLALTYAGFERRFEDWKLQRDLSRFDVAIGEIQKESANNRIEIANQEFSIANLQNTQAKEVLTFLENKFSNDHLYEWMIQVLSQKYRTLMQISANVARLAQRALEFERQEALTIIGGDYWSVSSVNAYSGNLSPDQKDSGLLGAERLLTDLTRLDAFKLSTEKRRLQMSKTISLAQMLPGELAILQTSGKVTFNTLLHWFDRDFPGHYLRLIKSVKISILALTPPIDGIHATLSNSGESTVVVHDGINHESKRAFRDFGETIALDSPFNETGLFVFDYNDPMFLPFEGLGVETQWVLELPKASNRFNFDTLIDVMFTIEYTALHNDRYAETVRTQLGTSDSNDIPLNVRLQFPDEWYHFKNDPVAADGTRKLALQLSQQFLPSHYIADTTVSTIHITVILMGKFKGLNQTQKDLLLGSIGIEHQYEDNSGSTQALFVETKFKTRVIDANNSQYALLSTRNNNDQSVRLDAGINPIGDWNISIKDDINLPDNATLGELLDDILIVVTTQGDVNWG